MRSTLLSIVVTFFLLTGCAVVTVQSQLAPNARIALSDPLYLDIASGGSIGYQKYTSALKNAVMTSGINVVSDRDAARYIMRLQIREFAAPIALPVVNAETAVVSGNVGVVPVSGTVSSYSTGYINSSIPTHNSQITVIDARDGAIVWTGFLSKSYEVSSHPELQKMVNKLISLYGREEKTSVMVGDEARW